MTGFLRRIGKGFTVVAALAAASGCYSLPNRGRHVASDDSAAESNCASCGRKRCSGWLTRGCGNGDWQDCKCEFDKEQLFTDHCWPDQYNRESVRRVNEPLARQLQAGMAIELTIWDHYFTAAEETQEGEMKPAVAHVSHAQAKKAEKKDEAPKPAPPRNVLNEAGKARLQYLSSKKPYVIKDLYLQTSFDDKLDEQRKQAVLAELKKYAKYTPQDSDWAVTVVNRQPVGTAPADAVFAATHAEKFSSIATGGGGQVTITREAVKPIIEGKRK
jgi:hypothetical protein